MSTNTFVYQVTSDRLRKEIDKDCPEKNSGDYASKRFVSQGEPLCFNGYSGQLVLGKNVLMREGLSSDNISLDTINLEERKINYFVGIRIDSPNTYKPECRKCLESVAIRELNIPQGALSFLGTFSGDRGILVKN